MANHYSDTAKFTAFKGKDHIPENHYLFPGFPNPWGSYLSTEGVTPKSIKGATCEAASSKNDGSRWTVTRIGPFVTHVCLRIYVSMHQCIYFYLLCLYLYTTTTFKSNLYKPPSPQSSCNREAMTGCSWAGKVIK